MKMRALYIVAVLLLMLSVSGNSYAAGYVAGISTLAPKQPTDTKKDKQDYSWVKDFYSGRAKKYEEGLRRTDDLNDYGDNKTYEALINLIVEKLETTLEVNGTNDALVLDAGAGTGLYTVPVSKLDRVSHVVAIDITQKMLDQLDAKIKAQELDNITTIQGSATDIQSLLDGIQHKRFHAIVSGFMTHHIGNSKRNETGSGLDPMLLKMLKEFYNALIPGGKAYIAFSYGEQRSLKKYAEAVGFRVNDKDVKLWFRDAPWHAGDLRQADGYIIMQKPVQVDPQFLQAA